MKATILAIFLTVLTLNSFGQLTSDIVPSNHKFFIDGFISFSSKNDSTIVRHSIIVFNMDSIKMGIIYYPPLKDNFNTNFFYQKDLYYDPFPSFFETYGYTRHWANDYRVINPGETIILIKEFKYKGNVKRNLKMGFPLYYFNYSLLNNKENQLLYSYPKETFLFYKEYNLKIRRNKVIQIENYIKKIN